MNKGEYAIELDAENGFVRVVASGELSKSLGEEIITKARTTAADHQYSILCDARLAEVKVSLSDWFFLPRTLPALKDGNLRGIKTAVVISPENYEKIYRFYETVTQNLGMNFKVFVEENEAVEWLKSSQ